MLMTIVSSLTDWMQRVLGIVARQMSHLNPQEYCFGLVFCICIGFVLLRGKN